ncbi:hypothetical protein AVEN_130431-1 [Araneus ventricosus]|uniref:Uncharacterized protein n=1 Tax=Araneus ventricosus TaxID=182803 RepID=A0A4Y2N7J8_ARAVE|nr:hypothetical protein AVEN_130431-1 [Araneus ventricosus]
MYRSFQNETNPLPKLWIRISDSESESVIPNPRNQSESNSDSRIRFPGFITDPIPRIRTFCSKSNPVVPFEDPDPRIRSGVNDSSLLTTAGVERQRHGRYLHLCRQEIINFTDIPDLDLKKKRNLWPKKLRLCQGVQESNRASMTYCNFNNIFVQQSI